MKCNWEWLSAYLDGALAEDKRAKLEEHLKTCELCTAKLEEFARVEQMAQKIPPPRLSEAYWENFANRVQNKLTIRGKQKTSPGWLEVLKSFFQPTAGRLAIAGSVVLLILLTFISLEQWKKQTFRPPVFEVEKLVAERKVDSIQAPAKDKATFQTAEKGKKVGLVEGKRADQPLPEKATAALSRKPAEKRPAASAPLGRTLAPSAEQKSNEEPSLATYTERDEAESGDTVVATAGRKKGENKEATASQMKVGAEEIQKLPIRNAENLLKAQASSSTEGGQPHIREGSQPVQRDTLTVTTETRNEIRKFTAIPQATAVPLAPSTAKSFMTMPATDTTQVIADIRQIIAEKEKALKAELSKVETESLYIFLAQHYVQLYRFSLNQNDWKKADQRLTDFLKTDLSESNRRWLVATQDELKKLKK